MDYKTNRYLSAYAQHYAPLPDALTAANCERMLVGLVHIQEIFNRSVEDLARLLAAVAAPPTKQKSVQQPPRLAPVPLPAGKESEAGRAPEPLQRPSLRAALSVVLCAPKQTEEPAQCFECRRFAQSLYPPGKGLLGMLIRPCPRHGPPRSAQSTPEAIYDERGFEL